MKKLAVCAILVSIVVIAILFGEFPKVETVSSIKLASLRDQGGVRGNFFLGTGQMETVPYYFFFKEVKGGGYQLESLVASNVVTVFEEDRTDGELRVYTRTLFRIGIGTKGNVVEAIANDSTGSRYEFVIPKGSIQRNFRLQ